MAEQKSSEQGNAKKALIVYSSQAGCTEEVVLKIKEKLDGSLVKTEVVKINDKDQCKSLFKQDLGQFSSILVGSSIIVGKVNKNAGKFLEKLGSASIDGTHLGFFVCCMKACDEQKIAEAKQAYIEPALKKCNKNFEIIDAFGGRLDFSPMSSLNSLMKKILKKIMLEENPGMAKVEDKVYDFRDWQQINKFASAWLNIIKNFRG